MNWMWVTMVLPLLLGVNQKIDPAEEMYFEAYQKFRQSQWREADKGFTKTLALLRKKVPKTKRARQLLVLGRADVLFHLAQSRWNLKQRRAGCQTLDQSLRLWKSLPQGPTGWVSWKINRLLPGRFLKANQLYSQGYQCLKAVPSELTVTGLPPKARIELQQAPVPPSKKPGWKRVSSPIQVLPPTAILRVTAKGFRPLLQRVTVKRWSVQKIKLTLVKLPKRRRPPPVIPRRRVPPPPKKVSPWVWVGVGVGAAVVVGTTVAIIASQSGDQTLLPRFESSAFQP